MKISNIIISSIMSTTS